MCCRVDELCSQYAHRRGHASCSSNRHGDMATLLGPLLGIYFGKEGYRPAISIFGRLPFDLTPPTTTFTERLERARELVDKHKKLNFGHDPQQTHGLLLEVMIAFALRFTSQDCVVDDIFATINASEGE
jgi:hypothetical protein